jgi:hypothetical protein
MPNTRAGLTVLLGYALLAATARGADPQAPPAAADPDPSFLEFLGSVDGLAEVNPNYLAQANAGRPPAAAPAAPPRVTPPPPPTPPPPSTPGAKNNE